MSVLDSNLIVFLGLSMAKRTTDHKPRVSGVISQKQRKNRAMSPNSLKNLKLFKPGQSGNPSGTRKGTPKISTALAKLLAMSDDEYDQFRPRNKAESLAYVLMEQAFHGTPATRLAAVKEITDRTEGRAPMRVIMDNTSELERLIIRIQERMLSELGIELTREEAIERIVAYRPELADGLDEVWG